MKSVLISFCKSTCLGRSSKRCAKRMFILQKGRAAVDWTEWRHEDTRGWWKWISPRALEWLAQALTTLIELRKGYSSADLEQKKLNRFCNLSKSWKSNINILQFLNHIMDGSDKIRTCWAQFNLMEWASASKSQSRWQSTIVTHKALCAGKKSLHLNDLFYVWWCMSCMISCW